MKHERERTINFRPVLFCALGLAFGLFLYGKCRFGGLLPSDFLFIFVFLALALFPLSKKRVIALLLSVAVFGSVGVLGLHLCTETFNAAAQEGEYRLSGTVQSVSPRQGYSVVVLGDLALDGENRGGKCRLIISGTDLQPADIIVTTANVSPTLTDDLAENSYTQSSFAADIRYFASGRDCEKVGRSKNPFLRLNAALYHALHENMERDEADLAYAMLTGSTGSLDAGLGETIRRGGIAHIFAVSGLHIGILYAAAYLVFRPLKKYRFLPALLAAFFYCGVCGFTVSALRAFLMCGVLGATRALGRKYDFLHSIALAGLAVLLLLPAQWYSAGMRLTFGACLGLALFSRCLSRLFTRLKFPRFLSGYLSAALSVHIFSLPVLFEAFGYVSVWGILLNFFLIPVLPVLFLGALICAVLALIIPPAAGVFLFFPKGMFSALLYLLSAVDVSLVLSGFALGAGAGVWLVGCVVLSERVRLKWRLRTIAAVFLAALFAVAVLLENVVFSGVRMDTYRSLSGSAALVRTKTESVLLIDGEISGDDLENFLRRTYGGELSLVVVLAEDEQDGINTAALLPAREIRAKEEVETGLQKTKVSFGEEFVCGELVFRYDTREKLVLETEGLVVEIDFYGKSVFQPDFFLDGTRGGLKYFLKNGIIKEV